MNYQDYRNGKGRDGEADDRCVPSSWLWDELQKFRGTPPHSSTKVQWKTLVGCVKSTGKYPDIKVKVDQRHYLTPREAAGIVLLALWDDTLRQIIKPELRSGKILAEDVPKLFDQWMKKRKGKHWFGVKNSTEIFELLQQIYASKQLTYDDLETISKKPIPPTTLRRWVQEAGGRFRSGEVCSMAIAVDIYERSKQWKPRSVMKRSPAS